ncbi:RNA polymerase sigma factor [Lacipirellula limnantheis]|uniref:ECF RNA polymerase sigma-E factor n=1 Tax=Lacipirellula limnantheis TaxID=2528024 RepID=A0A517U676_9BACT|nr:sigma-70 family RNA polymerase sigma factor [Lacipirellula limnantheis]QDT76132.1 ECF RNA polymerase sigma-E factor [Lacipirellula limnantheis]
MKPSAGQQTAETDSAQSVDLTSIVSEHRRWLRTVLAARGVERDSLDEVLQEVAAAACRGADQLNDRDRAGPWLYRIAVVQALHYRRRAGRRRRLVERYAGSGVARDEAVEYDPLAWLLAEETQQLVRQAIACLAPRDAELLLLKYTEDWSYRDLAERLGMSVSAVEARLHRARARMRAALASLAPEAAEAVR